MTHRTLIALAIVLTGLAFFAAEADFEWGQESTRHYYYNSTGFTSLKIAYEGDIELDRAQTGIARMSPGSLLAIRERRFTSRRRLEVRPDASGNPTYFYKVGARERSADEAEEYLASVMDDVVRSTTVGARSRARHLLEEDGLDGLLKEVSYLDSNAVRQIYLEMAAEADDLDAAQARDIVFTAGHELTSSSKLRATLNDLAGQLPAEWDLNAAFAEAAEQIVSSSEKGHALVEIAEQRGIAPAWEAFGDSASTIAAGSEKARTILRLNKIEPTPELVMALLSTADTIDASSERRRVLTELAAQPDLPAAIYSKALEVASRIDASSEKATVLAAMAPNLTGGDAGVGPWADSATAPAAELPAAVETSDADAASSEVGTDPEAMPAGWPDAEAAPETLAKVSDEAQKPGDAVVAAATAESLQRQYIEVASSIDSSSEARRALLALAASTDFSEGLCRLWLDSIDRISSSSVGGDLVVEAAAICPSADDVWRSFFAAVEQLGSSSEQRRAMMALLERQDLSQATLRGLAEAAERGIASRSELEAVRQRLQEVRSGSPT